MKHDDAASHPLSRRDFFLASASAAAAAHALPHLSPTAIAAEALLHQDAPMEEVQSKITAATIAEAQKLAGLDFSRAEREQMAQTIGENFVPFYAYFRDADLTDQEFPAELFDPRLPGVEYPQRSPIRIATPRIAAPPRPGPLPDNNADIAFAPATQLSGWIRARAISSERLTRIYLERLERLDPKLQCVVTLTKDHAIAQAKRADAIIASGGNHGPLHGLPYVAKDLFDTAGIPTTWGAAPYKDRVPDTNAAVIDRLNDAGAVLLAKVSLGALAYGDIWFGGRTNNPFNLEQGSSGSSAGSAACAAAGCAAFTLGTETYGSIMSPSRRCGATGFRPTFGRVSRAGAMALCWSLDKIGPICRTAADCALVLDAINGADPRDPCSVQARCDAAQAVFNRDQSATQGKRIGYAPAHYQAPWCDDHDRAALDALRDMGCQLVPVEFPDGPFGQLIFFLISVEAAASFDALTRSNRDDLMQWQEPQAWPNTFRSVRLAPAVEYVQAKRIRRRLMRTAHDLFQPVDAIIAPEAYGAMHALTNMTGQPAITIRKGFTDDGAPRSQTPRSLTPRSLTMWAGLYEDDTLLAIASALEHRLDVWQRRPDLD